MKLNSFLKIKNLLKKKTNTKIFISKLQNIKVGNDKYKTYLFLKKIIFLLPKPLN